MQASTFQLNWGERALSGAILRSQRKSFERMGASAFLRIRIALPMVIWISHGETVVSVKRVQCV